MRTLLGVVVLPVLLVLASSPAQADDRIGLSRDGSTWSRSLTEPLFDPEFRWVPGDVQTESFLVRNESTDGSRLQIDLRGTSTDSLLETGDLAVATRVGDRPWESVSRPGTHRLSTASVAPGEQSRVEVRVAFDAASQNRSEVKALALRFTVRLTQAAPGDGSSQGPGGLLPGTGGPGLGLLALGVVAVAAGVVVRREVSRHDA